MADNVPITSGSGTNIASDDVVGVHYQRVKLVDGTLDSTAPIPGDATNGLDVDVTRVGGNVTVVQATATNLKVDASGVAVPVTDNASTLSIDDGGGIITVDGTVTIGAMSPGTGASNLGKAEDAVHTDGDVGVMMLGVRQDADTSPVTASGDYHAPIFDANGNLKVNIKAGAGSGGTAMVDDAAFTVAVTSFTPVGGTYKSVRDAVDDNDGGAVAMTSKRALYTAIETPNGDSAMDETNDAVRVSIVADSIGSLVETDDGTVSAGQAAIAATLDMPYEFDGTNWTRPRGEHTVAHDAVDAGNPPKLGAKASTSLSGLTLVSGGDRTDLFAGVDGALIVRPHCNLEDIVSGVDTDTAGDSTAVIAAQGVGIKVYVTSVIVKNTHATTDAYVDIRDGAAGSVKLTVPAPPAGGAIVNLPVPLPFTANTAVCVDPSGAVSTIITTVIGFKSKI